MAQVQFMSGGGGFGVVGKKMNRNCTLKKHMAVMLTKVPARPRSKREGGRGSPKVLRHATHPITIRYDA
jgi:hypothetical protein